VLGYGSSGDAYHITSPAENGEGAQRAMRACLADGQIDPKDVGYINAHGTSTEQGTSRRRRAVKRVFGRAGAQADLRVHQVDDRAPARRGRGRWNLASSLLAATCGVIPPTINQFTPTPSATSTALPTARWNGGSDVALSNSFGFGGPQRDPGGQALG
jgi:3-oxoacyl-[acyl-carrier-protein] synthase II